MGVCVSDRNSDETLNEREPLSADIDSANFVEQQKIQKINNLDSIPIKQRKEEFSKSLAVHKKIQNEYEYLSKITIFSVETLRLLHNRFNIIDSSINKDGMISYNEFSKIIDFPINCIILKRFWNYMDKNNIGLNFRIFVKTMSILSNKNRDRNEKLKLSFSLYDINNDGIIDKNELKDIINDCLGIIIDKNIIKTSDDSILNTYTDGLVNITFKQINKMYNIDSEYITFDIYKKYVNKNPRILQPFNIDIENLVHYEQKKRRYYNTVNYDRLGKQVHHGPLHDKQHKIKTSKKGKLIRSQISTVISIRDVGEMCLDETKFKNLESLRSQESLTAGNIDTKIIPAIINNDNNDDNVWKE